MSLDTIGFFSQIDKIGNNGNIDNIEALLREKNPLAKCYPQWE